MIDLYYRVLYNDMVAPSVKDVLVYHGIDDFLLFCTELHIHPCSPLATLGNKDQET